MQPAGQPDAFFFGHGFMQQRRARRPFAADAETGDEAEQTEHDDTCRQAA
jgi:hypothetical protein